MTIGFDLTWMVSNNKSGGVFQYAVRLVSALVEHTNAKVVVLISDEGKGIFACYKNRSNFREVLVERVFVLKDVVEREQIDVIHTPIQSYRSMTMSVPMIVTLHDLQHLHLPEFFTKEEILNRNIYYRNAADFSERIIVSFEHVKEDLVKFYGVSPDKVDVCHLGFDRPQHIDQGRFPSVRKKYGLQEKYIFYSANTWRHKNHPALIRALKLVREKYGIQISLVCAGRNNGDYYAELAAMVEDLDLAGRVIFTGYIPEQELLLLLNNAALVVIPTLYEAGSFPLMEAMLYSVPVICSDVTSLPNTIGDRRFVFDPHKSEAIAEAIVTMFRDEGLMEENRANSAARLRNAGWDGVVAEFLNSYSMAIEKSKKNDDALLLKAKMNIYEDYAAALIEQMRTQQDELRASLSWKITGPFRNLLNMFRH